MTTSQKIFKLAEHAIHYGMTPERLAKLLTTSQQKFTRKNVLKLIQAYDNKWSHKASSQGANRANH